MKKISVTMHAAVLFMLMAWELREKLSGDPHFPMSLNGRGMTQKLKDEYKDIEIELSASHYNMFKVEQGFNDKKIILVSYSLSVPLYAPGEGSKSRELRYPIVGSKNLPLSQHNGAEYEALYNAFFKAHGMAGSIISHYQFDDSLWTSIMQILPDTITALAAKNLIKRRETAWLVKYIAKMNAALSTKS